MTDRFKFRAFNKTRKEMYDVYSFTNESILKNTLNGIGTIGVPDYYEDTLLMQCTGLTDKNGKLIYENDILKSNYNSIFIIKFNQCVASFVLEEKNKKESMIFNFYKNDFKIIGNIYENSKLLNGETE